MKGDTACIDELLGETARKKGITCPCNKCQAAVGRTQNAVGPIENPPASGAPKSKIEKGETVTVYDVPIPKGKSRIPDAKQRAAHDVNGSDE